MGCLSGVHQTQSRNLAKKNMNASKGEESLSSQGSRVIRIRSVWPVLALAQVAQMPEDGVEDEVKPPDPETAVMHSVKLGRGCSQLCQDRAG